MKRQSCMILILLVVSVILSGCINERNSDKQFSETTMQTQKSGIYSEQSEKIDLTPKEILSLSDNEIKEILNSYSNLKASENINIKVPKKAPIVDYTAKTPTTQDFENYHENFIDMFEYLFPNHTLNEDYLLYIGGSSHIEYDDNNNQIQDFNKVRDKYDDIVSGAEGRVHLLYDETWFRDMTEWKSPVCLELGSSIGYGYAIINKGKTVQLNGKVKNWGGEIVNTETYPCLESYDPADYLKSVGTYSPDSTESFKLLDKEIPINEAVTFFENYINGLPYPKESNIETCVIEVDVLKVNEDTYGYYFLTTRRYQGISFDHLRSGTEHSDFSNYSFALGNAFMIESNDVDIVYGYYRLQLMESITTLKEIITLETATQKISSALSDSVEFEVQKVELIYSEKPIKTSEGFFDTEGEPRIVSPAWKFTLYNPNDNVVYVAYVDAGDGENFRYFKIYNGGDE